MDNVITYLLRSGACLALFYGFYWVFLRKETFFIFNRFYLLAAAGLSLTLPLVHVTSPFFKTVVPASSLAEPVSVIPLPPPTAVDPLSILVGIYLAGAALFFFRFLFRLASLYIVARNCSCKRHDGLRVVFCRHHGEPFSFFNVIFVDRTKTPEGDLDRILTHEMVHVRQFHSFDIILSELVAIIQWFNPFVWPYKRSLRETHEYLADRAVIAQGCSLARYQLLIVEQHVGGELFELASSFRTSQIKRRISMLTKQESKGLARFKPLLILPLAIILVLAFAESKTVIQDDTAAISAPATPSAQEKSQEKDIQALKEKWLKLEQLKKENSDKTKILEKKFNSTEDPDTKAKIKTMLKEQKILAMELDAKTKSLEMKKAEISLNAETNAAKKAELKKMLVKMKQEEEMLMKKIEEVKKAEENGKEIKKEKKVKK